MGVRYSNERWKDVVTRVSVSRGEFALERFGSGPPLLFVHGFPLDRSMWVSQVEPLRASYELIIPDLLGFGESRLTDCPERLTMEDLAADLSELLEALGIPSATFCGLSMGGYVGWQFWRHHRTQLERLIMCDTRAIADDEAGQRQRELTARTVLRQGNMGLSDAMSQKLFANKTRASRPELIESTRQVIRGTSPEVLAAALRGMAVRPDVTSWLEEVDVPTLLLCGVEDTISTVDEMRQIQTRIPGAYYTVIEDAGHMSPLENPRVANSAILEFLSTV